MGSADLNEESFERRRRLAVAGFLAVLVLSQLGFFFQLRAGGFWSGYLFNAVFWTVAFVIWSWLMAPLRSHRGLLSTLLLLLVLGGEIGAWSLADGLSDSAYCSDISHFRDETCFIAPETAKAGRAFGFFFIPVTLITLGVSLTTALRAPAPRRLDSVPKEDPVAGGASPPAAPTQEPGGSTGGTFLIAAGIFVLAFVALLVFVILNISPPT